jgi:hypothetical protein
MAFEASIARNLFNIISVAVRAVPDSIGIFPFMMAFITINAGFFMRLVNDIHVIFTALGSNYHGQFR